MKLRIGYMETPYGTIEDTPDGGIRYTGNTGLLNRLFRSRIRAAQMQGQSMRAFVASLLLPHGMSNFHWAEPAHVDAPGDIAVISGEPHALLYSVMTNESERHDEQS